MKNDNTQIEQLTFYLESELASAEKMYLQNEVALRVSNELSDIAKYREQIENAESTKKGLESKIKHLRALIAELKDGTFKV